MLAREKAIFTDESEPHLKSNIYPEDPLGGVFNDDWKSLLPVQMRQRCYPKEI